MKKFFSLSILASCLVLTSCSKEKTSPVSTDPNDPGPLNAKLLVKTTEQYREMLYEYFPDRKIKKLTENSVGNPQRHTEYVYAPGSVTLNEFVNNYKQNSWTYFIDNNGRNTGCHYRFYNANGDILSENISTCTYNAAGQMVKEDFGNGNYEEFFYTGANLSLYKSYNAGVFNYQVNYEYYLDKAEKLISCGQFNSMGLGGIRAPFAKNLLKRRVVTNPGTQVITHDFNFTYEFDTDGFVTKGKYLNNIDGTSLEWNNTYQ